ncbi:MAG: hypothetical protein IJV27_04275 [Prevotella sp.]|nr:hypothetical protein [Prevotella sp.]
MKEILGFIDLNVICRVLEWVAVISLVLGLIGSYFLAENNMGILIVGVVFSFLDFVFLLFLSRIGDAVDDIRNKFLYGENIEESDID